MLYWCVQLQTCKGAQSLSTYRNIKRDKCFFPPSISAPTSSEANVLISQTVWHNELPWREAVERWLWSCWWAMSIWTSGWGRWGIGGCCRAGCAGRLRSRCERCPSAPWAETPVAQTEVRKTHKLLKSFLWPTRRTHSTNKVNGCHFSNRLRNS